MRMRYEPSSRAHEHFVDLWIAAHRFARFVGQQVLLRDIGDILRFGVFREQMVERLVFRGPHLGGDLLPPFFRIGEDRIDIVNDAAKRINAVFDNLANAEFSNARFHRSLTPSVASAGYSRGVYESIA